MTMNRFATLLGPFRFLLQPPRFGDDTRINDQAEVLHWLLVYFSFVGVFGGLVLAGFILQGSLALIMIVIVAITTFIVLLLVLRTSPQASTVTGIGLILVVFGVTVGLGLISDGIRHAVVVGHVIAISLAAVIGGRRGAITALVISILINTFLYYLDVNNIVLSGTFDVSQQESPQVDDMIIQVVLFFAVAVLLQATRRNENRAQAEQLAIQDELDRQQASLEEQVREQTRELALNLEISQRLSTYLDLNQLVREVVTQVQAAYGFYHVHIYLFDETKQLLRMAGGTGEAGLALLARGHHIPITSKGLVRRAATTGQPVLVNNTVLDPDWLPNPLLPDTKSELAVPMSLGEEVLGVLDVQENRLNAFSENQVALLLALSDQIALSLDNANTYTQTQSRARFETLSNTINRRLQSATSIDELLAIATEELGRALGAPQTAVQLETAALQQLSTATAQN